MDRNPYNGRRMDRMTLPTLRNWEKPRKPGYERLRPETCVEMGWGRIIFGQTFNDNHALFDAMNREAPGQRDITFYLRDPHVLLAMAPDRLFLDPSHTYRIWSHDYRPSKRRSQSVTIHRVSTPDQVARMNNIYQCRKMVTADPDFILDVHATKLRTYLVAQEARNDGGIVGTVTGVDHVEAFNDPELGASLWCLAVDPSAEAPGVGEALVRHLVEHYFTRGRSYVDLSVMHDNNEAIALYEKIGFQRVPVFCIKRKNPINEKLFMAHLPQQALNPYARIIVDEARRRGIGVEVVDAQADFFSLSLAGRTILCHESLTELTSSIAMMRCDDKRLTHRALRAAGFCVGDFIAFDAAPEITSNGFICARHLDDKAGVAVLLAAARAVVNTRTALPANCYLLFTISEEVGSGASAIIYGDVSEMVVIDHAPVAADQNAAEFGVTIGMMDQSGPFDYHLSHKLIDLCESQNIPYATDVYRYYRTDSASAIEAGSDTRTALIGFGLDGSHGNERTHMDSLEAVASLLTCYLQSQPTFMRDKDDLSPLEGFPHQPSRGIIKIST